MPSMIAQQFTNPTTELGEFDDIGRLQLTDG